MPRIIFALTTPVNEQQQADSEGYGRVVRRNADIDVYNAKARAVARELEIPVNDLNAFMTKAGPDRCLRPTDGIHLSPTGCQLVGRQVADVISKQLSE